MFDMDLPWWEFILRGAIVYGVLMVMVRVSGRRVIGQFTPFDLLVVMLLSESVSNSLSGGDNSLIGGLIIAATLVALNLGVAYLSSRSRKLSAVFEGTPVLLGRNGKLFKQVLADCKLSEMEVDKAFREADCTMEDMQCTFLEPDGTITVQKKNA